VRQGDNYIGGFKRWKRGEIELLRSHYCSVPFVLIEKLLGRSTASICCKAKALGLFRDPAVSGWVSPTNNPHERLSLKDRMYIATLLDGEGSIVVTNRAGGKTRTGKVRTPSRITILSAANTDRGLIEYLQSRLGGQIYTRFTSPLGRKPVHTWQIGGSLRCKQVLDVLYPFLREEEKKRRAQDVISYQTPVERRMAKSVGAQSHGEGVPRGYKRLLAKSGNIGEKHG